MARHRNGEIRCFVVIDEHKKGCTDTDNLLSIIFPFSAERAVPPSLLRSKLCLSKIWYLHIDLIDNPAMITLRYTSNHPELKDVTISIITSIEADIFRPSITFPNVLQYSSCHNLDKQLKSHRS
jgi:hypothetical protein